MGFAQRTVGGRGRGCERGKGEMGMGRRGRRGQRDGEEARENGRVGRRGCSEDKGAHGKREVMDKCHWEQAAGGGRGERWEQAQTNMQG